MHHQAEGDNARIGEGFSAGRRCVEDEQQGRQDEGRREDVGHQEAAERPGGGEQRQGRQTGQDRTGPGPLPDEVEECHGQPGDEDGLEDDDPPHARQGGQDVEQQRIDRGAPARDRGKAARRIRTRGRIGHDGAAAAGRRRRAAEPGETAEDAPADDEVVLAVGEQERVAVPEGRDQKQDRPRRHQDRQSPGAPASGGRALRGRAHAGGGGARAQGAGALVDDDHRSGPRSLWRHRGLRPHGTRTLVPVTRAQERAADRQAASEPRSAGPTWHGPSGADYLSFMGRGPARSSRGGWPPGTGR